MPTTFSHCHHHHHHQCYHFVHQLKILSKLLSHFFNKFFVSEEKFLPFFYFLKSFLDIFDNDLICTIFVFFYCSNLNLFLLAMILRE